MCVYSNEETKFAFNLNFFPVYVKSLGQNEMKTKKVEAQVLEELPTVDSC